jgi:allantoinase
VQRPLKSHGRYAYSGITRRADYSWPGGKRLAVYIGFNIEHFEFGAGLGAALGPKTAEPDVLNYSWRDYGNRVGVWRCLEVFESLKLPVGALINTALYDYCPEVIEAFAKRGDELIGHGHTNAERQGDMKPAEEKELLRSCRNRIQKESGTAPIGWLSPWISESVATPDLLADTGYKYTLNWCQDDQPTRFTTKDGEL